MYVQAGMSLRAAAEKIGDVSHQFVHIWAGRLLDKHPPDDDDGGSPRYKLKDGLDELVKSRKPGPAPGNCPKVDEILERVKEEKEKPFRQNIGALKIKVMSGVEASAKTVAKALRKAEFEPVAKNHKAHQMRVCKPVPNQQWNIDFVEIGTERLTGRKVQSLSVEDDHSR